MGFIDEIKAKAKADKKTIVLPESMDKRTYDAAEKILKEGIANIVIILLALIAVVNMANIISTGIINRKKELAAMQCIGMTQKQLYGMIAVECLQFVIGAVIVSAVLVCLLFFATEQFLNMLELGDSQEKKAIAYSAPLIRIALSSGFVYIVSLISAVIPLKQIEKESLAEQLRTID